MTKRSLRRLNFVWKFVIVVKNLEKEEKMAFWKPGQPNPPMKNLPGGNNNNHNNNNNKSQNNKNKNKGNNHQQKSKRAANVAESKIKLSNGSKVSMLTPATSVASSSAATETPVLSKSVLNMKFMQRKGESELGDDPTSNKVKTPSSSSKDVTKDGEDWFRNDRFVASSSQSSSSAQNLSFKTKLGNVEIVPMEEDEVDIYAQLPGRRSFNGCNKAMERHYQQIIDDKYLSKQQLAANNSSTAMITDEEMADRYEELVGLPRGPSQGKRPMKQDHNDKKHKKHKK